MKYRGPKELSEGLMDKFLALKDFKKQADILKEKLDVDKNLTEIKENEVKASDNMVTVNKFATDANIPNQLDLAAQYILQKVKLEKAIKDMEEEIKDKEEKLEEIEEEIDGYKNEIKDRLYNVLFHPGHRFNNRTAACINSNLVFISNLNQPAYKFNLLLL